MALAAQAVATAPKAPIPSPFAKLLRRTKFASYDNAIRQTYQAPPANAHRGDWGVKRPISLRRRNAFISLTSFEHHAHFTEWNHAENQVRFLRRFEEMGGKAAVTNTLGWYKSLGTARWAPPLDSDFCPGESAEFELESPEKTIMLAKTKMLMKPLGETGASTKSPEQTEASMKPFEETDASAKPHETEMSPEGTETVNLDFLGKRGPGAYGSQREDPPRVEDHKEVFVTHNIQAMSNREFIRYLCSLRAQRSEFQKFVNAEKSISNKNLHALAMREDDLCYRYFLGSQVQKEYADYEGQRIQPQPHPNGAAQYSIPTALETLLWTQDKPGFYLNDIEDVKKAQDKSKNFVVSFGGITTAVTSHVVVGKKMLLDKKQGVELENIEDSILRLRLNPTKAKTIVKLPCTVGCRPQGLKSVRVGIELIKGDALQMGWSNPHPLGSPEYVAMFSGSLRTENYRRNLGLRRRSVNWDKSQTSAVLMDTIKQTVDTGKKL